MLKAFIRFFKALNSNVHPGAIAHAVCLGMILGFLPKNNALWYILTVFFLFMRINKGSFILFTFLFSLLAPVCDNLFDSIGWAVLTFTPLTSFFSGLLEIPFVAFTRFNNTIVCGSLLSSLILYVPVYILVRIFLKYWRAFLAPAVRKTKLVVFLSKLPLIAKLGELV